MGRRNDACCRSGRAQRDGRDVTILAFNAGDVGAWAAEIGSWLTAPDGEHLPDFIARLFHLLPA